ncbi:MAG: hypothetical protein PHR35_17740 [Kiritimatiellae bacterium]|nr:hypothetical protein [Kiritimatiellia bacterium]
MRLLCAAGIVLGFGVRARTEQREPPADIVLWEDDGRRIEPREWRVVNGRFVDTNRLTFVSEPAGGKSGSLSRQFSWSPALAWLHVAVRQIEYTPGYLGWSVRADNTALLSFGGGDRAGLFTFYLPDYAEKFVGGKGDKSPRTFLLSFGQHAGIYRYASIRLTAQPRDAIRMTLLDGEPPGAPGAGAITRGDTLGFEVRLAESAADVTVTLQNTFCLSPVTADGGEYIQLVADDDACKVWRGQVAVSDRATILERQPGGVLVSATILGGAINEAYTTTAWPWKIPMPPTP